MINKIVIILSITVLFLSCKTKENDKNKKKNIVKKIKPVKIVKKNNFIKGIKKSLEDIKVLQIEEPQKKPELTIIYSSTLYGQFSGGGCVKGVGITKFSKFIENNQKDNPLILFGADCLIAFRGKYSKVKKPTKFELENTDRFFNLMKKYKINNYILGKNDSYIELVDFNRFKKNKGMDFISSSIKDFKKWKLIEHNGHKIALVSFNQIGQAQLMQYWANLKGEILKSKPRLIIGFVSGKTLFKRQVALLKDPPSFLISSGRAYYREGKKISSVWNFQAGIQNTFAGKLKIYFNKKSKKILNIDENLNLSKRIGIVRSSYDRVYRTLVKYNKGNCNKRCKSYQRRIKLLLRDYDNLKKQVKTIKNKNFQDFILIKHELIQLEKVKIDPEIEKKILSSFPKPSNCAKVKSKDFLKNLDKKIKNKKINKNKKMNKNKKIK
jgi:hypothetical protein